MPGHSWPRSVPSLRPGVTATHGPQLAPLASYICVQPNRGAVGRQSSLRRKPRKSSQGSTSTRGFDRQNKRRVASGLEPMGLGSVTEHLNLDSSASSLCAAGSMSRCFRPPVVMLQTGRSSAGFTPQEEGCGGGRLAELATGSTPASRSCKVSMSGPPQTSIRRVSCAASSRTTWARTCSRLSRSSLNS